MVAFARYFERERIPFRGVPAPPALLGALGQEWSLLGFGRQPALLALSKEGEIVHAQFGHRPRDIPDIAAALQALGSARGEGE